MQLLRRPISSLPKRQTLRANNGTAAPTTADRPLPIWPEPGQIHVQIVELLGVEAKRTRLPGLRLTLPGESDHERQLVFEECCSKMAEALGSPQMVEELVMRDGDQLLIHTVPFAGWWLMKKFAQEHEVNDVTHYLEAVDPGMSALIDGFLETASDAWDGVVASQIDRHGSVPDISMDGFLPPNLNRDVEKSEFDAWFINIAQSKRSFYLAERHGNHGAQNLFIENAPHLSGYELQTEMFDVEDQPLIDRFFQAESGAEPHPLLTLSSARAVEVLKAAKRHGITVTAISSAAVTECRSAQEMDFDKRARGMNFVAHDVISRRLRERHGPVIIHGGTGHGKLGHPIADKPGVVGLAAMQGWPTLLVEESSSQRLQTSPGTFYFTDQEFSTDRLIDDGPDRWASSKYDLRVWKKRGTWAAEAPEVKSDESDELTSEDDYDVPLVGEEPPADGSIVEHKGRLFRYIERMDQFVLLNPRNSDEEESTDDQE
jgi:hypothetical protein